MVVSEIGLLSALGAGIISFFSPCILPVLPPYLSFITGVSFDELLHQGTGASERKIILLNASMFVLGFSVVFISLGASASLVGQLFGQYKIWIARVGGVFVVLFGLHFLGILNIPLFERERRVHLIHRPSGYLGSALVGVAFSAGWTPCVSYALSPILILASDSGSVGTGVALLSVYSLGLGIPFLISALALQVFLRYTTHLKKHMRLVSSVSGIFLVVMGIWLLTDRFSLLVRGFSFLFSQG